MKGILSFRNLTLIVCLIIGVIYSLPNFYGEDPAVQITPRTVSNLDEKFKAKTIAVLDKAAIKLKSINLENDKLMLRFNSITSQLKAQDLLKKELRDHNVALNLAPATPAWLRAIGAEPMKLGLDLRGGLHFLMEVDIEQRVKQSILDQLGEIKKSLKNFNIRYGRINLLDNAGAKINFRRDKDLDAAYKVVKENFPELRLAKQEIGKKNLLIINFPLTMIGQIENDTMVSTTEILRRRINELGVAESIVQRQGKKMIIVELPGVQDTARAKDILGKTATLNFLLEDSENSLKAALKGRVPLGSKLYYDSFGQPILLKNKVILTGESIVGAHSGFDSRDNKPNVSIRLSGKDLQLFRSTTKENIGNRMAVVYREVTFVEKQTKTGVKRVPSVSERVISLATIQQALGNQFQITGLDRNESRDLALLLRSGSLPTSVAIVEERIVGPSLGDENIYMGMLSIGIGLGLVLFFMAIYYSVFGLIANVALIMNMVLLVALMSILGATLTLPGIAGIVLTLGMAVDANVLIFERIREELRVGASPGSSIIGGFQHAFRTIVDANVTTLIVGIILFAIGIGPVRGFAVTLSLGILTSMFTATTGTRAIVDLVYSSRPLNNIRIGI